MRAQGLETRAQIWVYGNVDLDNLSEINSSSVNEKNPCTTHCRGICEAQMRYLYCESSIKTVTRLNAPLGYSQSNLCFPNKQSSHFTVITSWSAFLFLAALTIRTDTIAATVSQYLSQCQACGWPLINICERNEYMMNTVLYNVHFFCENFMPCQNKSHVIITVLIYVSY